MTMQLEVPLFQDDLTFFSQKNKPWASSFPTFQTICHQRLLQIYDAVLQGQAGLVGYFSKRTVGR